MSRVVRVLSLGLHPAGYCEDCAQKWSSSGAARDNAKDHAKRTGHSVVVETVTVDKYRREGDQP